MFIQTENTPNPKALKFLPGLAISPQGPVFFSNNTQALQKSSLAAKIFQIGNIEAVFYGADFITVTKRSDKISWEILKPEILMIVMDHLVAEIPIFDEPQNVVTEINTNGMNDIEKQIVEIIETRVRPSVAMDGGDIIYRSFEKGVVYLQLRGACSGCPSSLITLKHGIESMLRHFVPEVQSVEAIHE